MEPTEKVQPWWWMLCYTNETTSDYFAVWYEGKLGK